MKKSIVLLTAAALFLILSCASALAADYDITGTTGTLNIPAGTHSITGTATDLSIVCDPGVTLTANGVSIISSSTCPLIFNGVGNELILAAGTTNTFTADEASFNQTAGISVLGTVALTISGSGELNANGGYFYPGIGGNTSLYNCGTINITGGTVNANGGFGGAGIGGAWRGTGGTVTISGGTVTAIGKDGGAGIGGGQGSNQTGGVGYDGGTVIISGGTVYASNGGTEARDIGYGLYGSGGTLTLSGSAAVFLAYDSYVTPTILGTQTHYNPVPFVGNTANGITVPASWTSAQGAFLPPAPDPTPTPEPTPTPAATYPLTGDDNRVVLWLLITGVAGSAIVLTLKAKRRHVG